jgi:DNA polymerase-3 subunit gamma/tau
VTPFPAIGDARRRRNEEAGRMAYQVIARKWRPQTFADVVGQEHVVRTLQNQLLSERTAHAYLFVGPRGIGKTTIARIFAKALNCRQAPIADPCCACDNCVAIADGSSLDVIEIDGASNNGVENVRQLREEVMYTPVSSRFKVYIIDEVHMLTQNAWNALLKTVEEPPAHVKFIFATTEAHKVLATIVSRCQRFDLRRLTTRLIRDHLRRIAEVEKIPVTDAALAAIARAADGGMRDGQSLLDQMISFFSGQPGGIAEEQVLNVFGLTNAADMEQLIESLVTNRAAGAIAGIHALCEQGKDLEKLFDEILAMLRGVQICHLSNRPEDILDEAAETIAQYRRLAEAIAPDRLQLLLETLAPAGRTLHDALNKQVYLETMILKAMRIAHGVQLADLLRRLNEVRAEGSLEVLTHVPPATATASPTPPPNTTAAPATNTVAPVPPPPPPVVAHVPAPTPSPQKEAVPVAPISPAVPPVPAPASPVPAAPPSPAPLLADPPAPYPAADTVDSPPSQPAAAKPMAQPIATEPVAASIATPETPLSAPPAPDAMAAAATNPPHPVVTDKPSATTVRSGRTETPDVLWHLLIQDMNNYANTKGVLKAHMQAGKPESYENGVLSVVYDEEFEEIHTEELRRHLPFLNKCLSRVSGNPQATLRLHTETGVAPAHDDAAADSHLIGVRQRVEKNQFVQTVMDLFEGEIVQVRG